MLSRSSSMFACVVACAGIAALCGTIARAADPVAFFSPQGEIKGVRQVTARFATAMVPFGDPRELDPFAIDCSEKGHGRWADSKTWIYDFDRDLPAGVRCGFALKSGIAALDGSVLQAGQHFYFNTGGPAILRSLPWEGTRIDENQIFILGLDAPARSDTVLANAHCIAAGIHERIGVRLVTGDERKLVLDNRKSFAATYLRAIFLDEDAGRARSITFRLPTTGSDDDKFIRLRDAPDSPLLTLACARTLPAGAEVKVVWGKGIASSSGITTTTEQPIAFDVRPTFRASFSCQRVNKDAQCMPILPLTLSFSASISARDASRIRLVDVGGKTYAAKLPKNTDDGDSTADATNAVDSVSFGPGLPESHSFRIELPAGLKDDAGRSLSNASSFPLRVRTDENPPLAKFTSEFGILEAALPDKSTPLLPVTVRNIEPAIPGRLGVLGHAPPASADAPIAGVVARIKPGDEMQIVNWFGRIEEGERVDREYDQDTERWTTNFDGHAQSIFESHDARQTISVPKPGGGKAFEVIGIPLAAPGFYIVELASPRLGAALFGERKPYFVRTSALVTNLGVHFKRGRESSLVWVTHLADGKPTADAQVSVRDCGGKTYWQGRSDASGVVKVNVELPALESLPRCGKNYRKAYFVTARAGADMAFVFSDWNEGISPWRFNVPTGNDRGAYVAHAVLDRPLFRAGDTASMKIFVRKLVGRGFTMVPRQALQETLTIRHQGSDRKYAVPVHWDGGRDDATHGEASFAIPKDADLGTYTISIRDSLGTSRAATQDRYVGSFRVEAFRVPLMRARLQAAGEPLVNPVDIKFDVQVSYLAGGGAGGLPVKLRTQFENKSVSFPDFDDYAFATGNVKEGREEQGDSFARFGGNTFADPDMGDDDETEPSGDTARQGSAELPLTLDSAGGVRANVRDIGRSEQARDLIAELEYRDPNGETLTAATRAAIWPARVVLGIKPDSWVASKEKLKFTMVAVDPQGKPLSGIKVSADAFKRETYSHRRRLIGGFYAFEHGAETRRLGALCAGETDGHGVLICEVAAPASGNLILRAQATDGDGNLAVTRADAWVATGEDWWFAASDNDRVDLLPEQKRYEPGSTARLQIRMPFKEATALITVEREGVLESFVRTIKRSDPVIELPVKGEYAPNVFVSVFLVRGRVGGVAPTAMIDLGKPSFKMGLAELRVGWAAHELSVTLKPEKDTYKVRDKAKLAIAVRRVDGTALPRGAEVAIAAVDEGLLELLPNDSWKLLDAMMTRRGEEVETSTAQMQVIGKRHFGRKAIAAGGGGGRQSARELFDTLLLWRARVPLDDAGNATIDIPLNDSLTSFRLVAVASAGADLFGTGYASIRSTQDLMLLSGLPPLVREGDQFRATITVRNASARRIQATLTARATATAAATGASAVSVPRLPPQAIDLEAGQARELFWDVTVPLNAVRLDWQIDAVEGSGAAQPAAAADGARDALKTSQVVIAAVPVRTFQATILQLTGSQEIAVQRPADAIAGRGGINVSMQATLAGELPGVREYLTRYPYSCFEQQTSIAVGLRDRSRWDALMRTIPAYLDRDGMVKYWPVLKDGDDSLTAYVLSVAAEAGWEIPDDARARMEAALIGFVEGRIVRFSALPTADLSIRKIAALEALSRRAEPINAKWLDSISLEPNLWPTSAVIDWYWILKRSPKLPKHDARIAEAEQIMRSRLNFQGTTMGFSTEKSDALWWLMVSADSNANKLLLALLDEPAWRDDMPRLARGTLMRMQRGHWNTTVANAWGTLALEKFSAAFESTPVAGITTATLADAHVDHAWSASDGAKTFDQLLPWPPQRANIALTHQGAGQPWVTLQSLAAIPLQTPLSSGYNVTRTVTPLQQATAGRWSRGDVARVHLDVDAQSDMAWVVVDDPIPAGSTVLGRGLGGDSTIATQNEKKVGAVWPAFEERTFQGFRAYYRYVPKGRFVVEYTVRLNNPGDFHLPATRVEAMYAPEMFGELPNADWTIRP